MDRALTPLEETAATALRTALGDRPGAVATAAAPGRCTLVGEHVDYADGLVLCIGVDLGIGVAVRPSADGRHRVVSGARRAERDGLQPAGDVGDLPLAAAAALAESGVEVLPVEAGVAATLPEAAGLSSSAALVLATLVALLRLTGASLPARRLADLALHAERDLVGVPCGPLDQRAVVGAPASGALLLDCRSGSDTAVSWGLRGVALVACHTGEAHDVGGEGYRTRRREADDALRALGAGSYRDLDLATVGAARLREPLAGRARHIVSETLRAVEAAAALRAGDARRLGELMNASHDSLRDDYAVSTPALDAAVAAARSVPGCHGARMVGAGFGGTAVALVDEDAAGPCATAMERAVGEGRGRGSWRLHPAPGLAATCPDVVR